VLVVGNQLTLLDKASKNLPLLGCQRPNWQQKLLSNRQGLPLLICKELQRLQQVQKMLPKFSLKTIQDKHSSGSLEQLAAP
jgi:hypothetical protein